MPLASCSRYSMLNSSIPWVGYTRTSNVLYGPQPRQKLDYYIPDHINRNGDIVVFFYGGDWQAGSKDDYRFAAEALTSRGFIAVLPDYRLYPSVTFPAFVQDGALAIRWVHDNANRLGGNPRHIFLMGHSAGAHIAALLTLDPHYLHDVGLDRNAICATVAIAGPYDFVPWNQDRPIFHMVPHQPRPSPPVEPIDCVDGHAPPILLLHGKHDLTVDVGNADRLAARIKAAGGSVRYICYPEGTHVNTLLSLAWEFRWMQPTLHDSSEFFRELDHQPEVPAQVVQPKVADIETVK
jgi:acetyl esterase/lipase